MSLSERERSIGMGIYFKAFQTLHVSNDEDTLLLVEGADMFMNNPIEVPLWNVYIILFLARTVLVDLCGLYHTWKLRNEYIRSISSEMLRTVQIHQW